MARKTIQERVTFMYDPRDDRRARRILAQRERRRAVQRAERITLAIQALVGAIFTASLLIAIFG